MPFYLCGGGDSDTLDGKDSSYFTSKEEFNESQKEFNESRIEILKEIGDVKDSIHGGVHAGDTPPEDITLLWIDTSVGGIPKYYNGSSWVATASVWG